MIRWIQLILRILNRFLILFDRCVMISLFVELAHWRSAVWILPGIVCDSRGSKTTPITQTKLIWTFVMLGQGDARCSLSWRSCVIIRRTVLILLKNKWSMITTFLQLRLPPRPMPISWGSIGFLWAVSLPVHQVVKNMSSIWCLNIIPQQNKLLSVGGQRNLL